MSTQDNESTWRQSLERLGQAALDLVSDLGGRVGSHEGPTASGTTVTETRDVSGFTQVKLSGFGTLHIAQTGTESLTISADESVMPYLTSDVINGTLELGAKARLSFKLNARPVYTVTVKSLEGIQLTGAGAITAADIRASAFSVAISGAGDLTISGGAQSQSVKISGAGNYNAKDFATDETEVKISGAGNAHVSASQTLNAAISGAGVVTYYGSPQVTQRTTGIGSVKQGS